MEEFLQKIEKEITGCALPADYRRLMSDGAYKQYGDRMHRMVLCGTACYFCGFLDETGDPETDLYLYNRQNAPEDGKYLVVAKIFLGMQLLLCVKGAFAGKLYLLKDGEEDEGPIYAAAGTDDFLKLIR